jgi:hypothetical protein
MTFWSIAAWVVTAGSVAALVAALIWIGSASRRGAERFGDADLRGASREFSFDRYQVMERLLSPADLRFLAAWTAPGPGVAPHWRRESVRIFRSYLDELTADFHALHAYAREMVAASHAESPELARVLLRQQATFFRARVLLEARLLLFGLGLGAVNAAPLLGMVEAMRLDVARLVPEDAPAA